MIFQDFYTQSRTVRIGYCDIEGMKPHQPNLTNPWRHELGWAPSLPDPSSPAPAKVAWGRFGTYQDRVQARGGSSAVTREPTPLSPPTRKSARGKCQSWRRAQLPAQRPLPPPPPPAPAPTPLFELPLAVRAGGSAHTSRAPDAN